MRAASRLLFCCPFFRKGFVSISISDHPLEIFVSLLLLAVGVVVFLTLSLISEVFCFFCLDQLGLRNNFCELVGIVIARKLLSELRKIAIISFGRFVLFWVDFFFRYPSFPVCFGSRTGRGCSSRRAGYFFWGYYRQKPIIYLANRLTYKGKYDNIKS